MCGGHFHLADVSYYEKNCWVYIARAVMCVAKLFMRFELSVEEKNIIWETCAFFLVSVSSGYSSYLMSSII